MKKLPKIAIVGRPNVGKSALFNRLAKKRIAIVDEAEGITRDRLYAEAECFGRAFEVIDTGGIDPKSKVPFQEEIRWQAEIAIEEADGLILVVDGQVGVTVLDEMVATLLRKTGKKVVVAVNKIDDFTHVDQVYPFYELGIASVIGISATHNFQVAELLEEVLSDIQISEVPEEESSSLKIAFVGRTNVGKSTIVNFLLGEKRCVVSPIAGTTRDSIDTEISWEGDPFTLIDTAGIRRKAGEHESVDKFAAVRTERAIERADICVLVLDAERGITTQDKRIAREIEEKGKGCIVLFNKWDLVKGFRMEHCQKSFEIDTPFLLHCPLLFASGLTGRNVQEVFAHAKEVHAQQNRRISTGQLNSFVEKALQKCQPSMSPTGKRLKIYYLAQVDVQPPRFVLFVNKPDLLDDTYKKYLINQFRETYGFSGSPIFFFLKGKGKKEESASSTSPTHNSLQENVEEIEEWAFEETSEESEILL